MIYLYITVSIFIITLLYWKYKQYQNRYQNPSYLQHVAYAKEFIQKVNAWNTYITWVEREAILTEYRSTLNFFKDKSNLYKKESIVQQLNAMTKDFSGYVKQYNVNYVAQQKQFHEFFFDTIEGKSLDDQQRTAVVTDEYSNLVVAGAGSGKTLTLMAKVKYLVEVQKMDPKHILLLSFTKDTVKELNDRLKQLHLNVEAQTFHKLGYQLIKDGSDVIPVVTNENTLRQCIREYLSEKIYTDTLALQAYIEYVACYMYVPESMETHESLGEKIDLEKGLDLETLKSKTLPPSQQMNRTLDALQGERVKSVEELMIANFLYLNGIKYAYERSYPHSEEIYRPDFYLIDYDIYLEHFGVDEHFKASWLTEYNEQKYVEGIEWKRALHKTHQTQLIETFSYFNRNHQLLPKLTRLLEKAGVTLRPIDVQMIFERLKGNDKRYGKELEKLIYTFVSLAKSKGLKANEIERYYEEHATPLDAFLRERQRLFLQFALPIVALYDETLNKANEIDFHDMINGATDLVSTSAVTTDYRYIIIDEFQDISYSRFQLIQAIRDQNKAHLLCVGDDWQSIYRFAGSDVSLFRNFGKFVGEYQHLLVEQTYRNSQQLIDISSKFVLKNPFQIEKKPKSSKQHSYLPVRIHSFKEGQLTQEFLKIVDSIYKKFGAQKIYVLGRHTFDLDRLMVSQDPNDPLFRFDSRSGTLVIKGYEAIDAQFLTVHRSKGLEADHVILLNMTNDLLGFPNKMGDDLILHALMNDEENFRFAEERRLFYVALTRTKKDVYLLCAYPEESLFINELKVDLNYKHVSKPTTLTSTQCTYCKTGKLVVRTNPKTQQQFLGCSHYPICDQTYNHLCILEDSILCASCKSGYMTKREGKHGVFLGCTNYPGCKETISLNVDKKSLVMQ